MGSSGCDNGVCLVWWQVFQREGGVQRKDQGRSRNIRERSAKVQDEQSAQGHGYECCA